MLLQPPALQAPAPPSLKPQPLAQAEDAVLLAFDEGSPLPSPAVAAAHRPALAWLRANAGPAAKAPANPFRPGTPEHREAAQWLAFLKAPPGEWEARLPRLSPHLTGTQLGLWRWGQAMSLAGRLSPEARRTFEDQVATSAVEGLRAWALRHALCHAVAERDEGRFARLRDRHGALDGELFPPYQRLFALLDGPAPQVRLFTLPGLEPKDLSLADLGGRRVWVLPPGEGRLDPLPSDVAWIIPAGRGTQDPADATLDGATAPDAEALDKRLRAAGRRAWFAPSRVAFEAFGLIHFPILIDLDGEQRIRRIRMGDAAPEHP
jgi:hypothetical protein